MSAISKSTPCSNGKDKDILDDEKIKKESKSIFKRILGHISKVSPSQQIVLGASTGWVTGLISMKVGKTAALALGGGIILLQIANEKGYIQINWDKVNRKIDQVANKVEEKVSNGGPSFMDKVMKFARNNNRFASGFVGGFLIGLASH